MAATQRDEDRAVKEIIRAAKAVAMELLRGVAGASVRQRVAVLMDAIQEYELTQ